MAKRKEKNVEHVIAWRRRVKKRLVQAFGGRCGLCGYDKTETNLAFHHVDPRQKDFNFGQYQSKSWATNVAEIRKCVLLCHNCHGEVHAGLADIAECPRFNEEYADRPVPSRKRIRGICMTCRAPLKTGDKFCSVACAHVPQQRVERPTKLELDALLRSSTWESLAARYGVHSNAIRKWADRYGLDRSQYRGRKDNGRGTRNRTEIN